VRLLRRCLEEFSRMRGANRVVLDSLYITIATAVSFGFVEFQAIRTWGVLVAAVTRITKELLPRCGGRRR